MNASRLSLAAPLVLALAAVACSPGTPQSPPAGTLTIVTRGGAASNGSGGSGGQVSITGSGGGPLQLLRSGSFDPTFTVDTAQPALGANPKTISAGATLVVGDPLNPVNGDVITTQPATGLWVKPGVTLTLQPFAPPTSLLALSDGVFVEGTLTATRDASGNSTSVTLYVANLVVTSAGAVDLSGADAPAAAGGSGGTFEVRGLGAIANAGRFTARGGNGTAGGLGGTFRAASRDSAFSSSGAIDVSGGTGSAGVGGSAGNIMVGGSIRVLNDIGSSGALTAHGGDGSAGGGGGGAVQLSSFLGGVRSSSSIDTSGGTVTSAGTGIGGTAGPISLTGGGRDVLVAGSLRARGGAGVGAPGGAGNVVTIARNRWFPPLLDAPFASAGSLELAADIDTSGGAGTTGGAGSSVVVDAGNLIFDPGRDGVALLGYAAIDTSGATSPTGGNGGFAGSVLIAQRSAVPAAGGNRYCDGILNEVPITAKGGDGNAVAGANGGGGGPVSIRTPFGASDPATRSTVNLADVVATGGTGTGSGGGGGALIMYENYMISNAGKVFLDGGAGGTASGGSGGGFDFEVLDGPFENLGELRMSGGGTSAGSGGRGGRVFAYARRVTAIQNMAADGGASTTGPGGSGGLLELISFGSATTFGGTASVKAGAGAAAATPVAVAGTVMIDGVARALTNGQYTK